MKNFSLKNLALSLLGLGAILSVFLAAACRDNSDIVEVLPNVTVGEEFEIILDAYGSTPYLWSYEIKPDLGIEYIAMDFIPTSNNPDLIGGGQVRYTFKATKYGNYKIKYELQNSWESSTPIETKIYQITIVE